MATMTWAQLMTFLAATGATLPDATKVASGQWVDGIPHWETPGTNPTTTVTGGGYYSQPTSHTTPGSVDPGRPPYDFASPYLNWPHHSPQWTSWLVFNIRPEIKAGGNGPFQTFLNQTYDVIGLNTAHDQYVGNDVMSPQSFDTVAATVKAFGQSLGTWEGSVKDWLPTIAEQNSDLQGSAAGAFRELLSGLATQIGLLETDMGAKDGANALASALNTTGTSLKSALEQLWKDFDGWAKDKSNLPEQVLADTFNQHVSAGTHGSDWNEWLDWKENGGSKPTGIAMKSNLNDTWMGDSDKHPGSRAFADQLDKLAQDAWKTKLTSLDVFAARFATSVEAAYDTLSTALKKDIKSQYSLGSGGGGGGAGGPGPGGGSGGPDLSKYFNPDGSPKTGGGPDLSQYFNPDGTPKYGPSTGGPGTGGPGTGGPGTGGPGTGGPGTGSGTGLPDLIGGPGTSGTGGPGAGGPGAPDPSTFAPSLLGGDFPGQGKSVTPGGGTGTPDLLGGPGTSGTGTPGTDQNEAGGPPTLGAGGGSGSLAGLPGLIGSPSLGTGGGTGGGTGTGSPTLGSGNAGPGTRGGLGTPTLGGGAGGGASTTGQHTNSAGDPESVLRPVIGPDGSPVRSSTGEPRLVPDGATITPDGQVLGPDHQPILDSTGHAVTAPPGSTLGPPELGSSTGGLDLPTTSTPDTPGLPSLGRGPTTTGGGVPHLPDLPELTQHGTGHGSTPTFGAGAAHSGGSHGAGGGLGTPSFTGGGGGSYGGSGGGSYGGSYGGSHGGASLDPAAHSDLFHAKGADTTGTPTGGGSLTLGSGDPGTGGGAGGGGSIQQPGGPAGMPMSPGMAGMGGAGAGAGSSGSPRSGGAGTGAPISSRSITEELAAPAGRAGSSGAAGSGMPMMPMTGGAGGGKKDEKRTSTIVVTEDDEEVWSATQGERSQSLGR